MPYRNGKAGNEQKGVYEKVKMPFSGGKTKKSSNPSKVTKAPKMKYTQAY